MYQLIELFGVHGATLAVHRKAPHQRVNSNNISSSSLHQPDSQHALLTVANTSHNHKRATTVSHCSKRGDIDKVMPYSTTKVERGTSLS